MEKALKILAGAESSRGDAVNAEAQEKLLTELTSLLKILENCLPASVEDRRKEGG